MKGWMKRYTGLGIVAFIVFLLIYYWDKISGMGTVFMFAITPLLGGVVIAYIVNIPMDFYEKTFFGSSKNKILKKLKRPVCMLLSFVTVAMLIMAVVVLILPELTDCINLIIRELPPFFVKLYEDIEQKYEISTFISQNVAKQFSDIKDVTDVVSKFIEWVFNGFGNVVGSLFSIISTVFSTVFAVFMSFVFAVYLLFGKERIFSGISRLANAYIKSGIVSALKRFVHVVDQSFHRFIVGQCTEAIILGVLCIIGMHLFDFPYATMIGTLIGFTALIPIAGAYIGAAIGAIMILTAGSWLEALLFVVFIIVLQQLEGNLIYPKVVGASIGLPGIWVMATVTVAGSLGGVAAILIGVPLAATAYRLIRGDVRKRLDGKDETADSDEAGKEVDNAEESNTENAEVSANQEQNSDNK